MKGVCKICGCTWHNPCFNHQHGFCWWVNKEEDLCSHCAEELLSKDPNTIHCVHGMVFPVLSVHQPYALMLVEGKKEFEYRTWKLPQKYVGQRIFIHAGKTLEWAWEKPYSNEEDFYKYRDKAYAQDLGIMILGSVVFGESQGPYYSKEEGYPSKIYKWPVFNPIKLDTPLTNISGKQRVWKMQF